MQESSSTGQLGHFWKRTFGAFHHGDFRWYALGMVAASTAFRVEEVAQGWVVYTLTGSALALSWVRISRSVAIISFSLIGGTVADRVKKRTMLIVGNGLVGLIPLVLAVLIFTNKIQWWHLAIGAALEALLFSFVVPARQAFVGALMKPHGLLNAMALEVFILALPGVLFSLVSGALVDWLGAEQVYLLVFFIYGLTVVLFMQLASPGAVKRVYRSPQVELVAGIRYVSKHQTVLPVLGLGAMLTVLLVPAQVFLPVFAVDVFQTGALGLGLLAATWSLGRVTGALLVATLGDFRRKGLLLLGLGAMAGLFAVLFAQSFSFYPALLFMGLTSMTQNAYKVTESTILQSVTSEEMRGRVAGSLRSTEGLVAVAILPLGLMADRWGVSLVVSLTGAIAALLFVSVLILRSSLNNLK